MSNIKELRERLDRYEKEIAEYRSGTLSKPSMAFAKELHSGLSIDLRIVRKEFPNDPYVKRLSDLEYRSFELLISDAVALINELRYILDSYNLSTDFWCFIHESILNVAKTRFEAGHYADAAVSACLEVNSRVKEIMKAKTGKEIVKTKTGRELDGASLMTHAFSTRNPIIELNDLSTENGRNIQEGYMHLFTGTWKAIRNPKTHANIDITLERGIHFIFLTSLLMHKLDEVSS